MKKNAITFFLLHFFLFLGSCNLTEDDCICPPPSTVEVDILNVDLTMYSSRSLGTAYNDNSTEISKEDFLIYAYLESEYNEVAKNTPKIRKSSFGFQAAYACSCVPPRAIVLDPVRAIKVLQWDTAMEMSSDVTDAFGEIFFTNTEAEIINTIAMSIENTRQFEEDLYFVDSYGLVITNPDIIQNKGLFEVELTLESGEKISQLTSLVRFQ